MNNYEWTPHGLQMLKDIENSIQHYGGRGKLLFSLQAEHHKGYTCNKSDCEFCYKFNLKVEKPLTKTKRFSYI